MLLTKQQWIEKANELIAEHGTADDSHAELMELLLANDVPRAIAKPLVDDMRPGDGE
jgi:hypothetical protein